MSEDHVKEGSAAQAQAYLAAHGLSTTPGELDGLLFEAVARLQRGLYAGGGHELTEVEAEELRCGGFDLEVREAGPDPIAEGIVEFAAMMKTALTVRAAAALAGVNQSRIRQRLNAKPKSLLGIRVGGRWCIPAFQFDHAGGRTLPGLETVISALDPELHPVSVQRWFLEPKQELAEEGLVSTAMAPRDWLLAGLPPERVAELARGI